MNSARNSTTKAVSTTTVGSNSRMQSYQVTELCAMLTPEVLLYFAGLDQPDPRVAPKLVYNGYAFLIYVLQPHSGAGGDSGLAASR